MEIKELTCIGCPMGCQLTVEVDKGVVVSVKGNTCKIGENYARKEVVNPMRIVTSSVAVLPNRNAVPSEDIHYPRISVKTASEVPKDKIMDVMDVIKGTYVFAPVRIGDVILHNVADTGVDVVATKKYGS
ncbi:MAG: DUF1667 domain-containing protein, partial [Proteobacteria bacterium]|nr:DUF1667 domain-containing protein [Pseudomonadota bacterium]